MPRFIGEVEKLDSSEYMMVSWRHPAESLNACLDDVSEVTGDCFMLREHIPRDMHASIPDSDQGRKELGIRN